MYISLYDLAYFILFVLAVIIAGYLIAVLRRALGVLSLVQGILTAHQGDIRATVSLFQETLTNVNELTVSLKEATVQTASAVRAIPSEITDTVEDLRESFETFALYARIAGEVVKSVFSK
ncbi:hypothetical protein [Sporomusa malonica]|uniref:DUF948 domain-containing protein n=1 Tax=Sporomusa malonica TaxID=112901 RepID=A0A1W2CW35_9FIRM|nr:hypothetical protein [Sporomusa malonica]SMC89430.1 hypothetical protein SAMN04488500_11225 [Sporomusa malonica]